MSAVAIFTISVAAVVLFPACCGLSERCSTTRTACNTKYALDQNNNVPNCVAAQSFMDCLATAITGAEKSGTCDTLMVYTYRNEASEEAAVTYAASCPNFVMPPSMVLSACGKQMGTCGKRIMHAFSTQKNDTCSIIGGFQTCMTSQTTSCVDRQSVENILLQQLQVYQTCSVVMTSYSSDCAKKRTSCAKLRIEDEQNNLPECTIGFRYFDCVSYALQAAETSSVCGVVQASAYRDDDFQEAEIYRSNCEGFKTPQYLALDSCGQAMARCGRFFTQANANAAYTKNNQTAVCSELTAFRSCMEGIPASCVSRTIVNNLLQRELIFYQYEAKCIPTWTAECSRVRTRCTQQLNTDQVNNLDPCMAARSYYDCVASALSAAEIKGNCSLLQRVNYIYNELKEAETYVINCPTSFVTPSYLSSLTPCETELALCGDLYSTFSKSNNDLDCGNIMVVFKFCMGNKTRSCVNRKIIEDIVSKADQEYCNAKTTTTTTAKTTTTTAAPTTTTTTKTSQSPISTMKPGPVTTEPVQSRTSRPPQTASTVARITTTALPNTSTSMTSSTTSVCILVALLLTTLCMSSK